LPKDYPFPILIVQHIAEGFTEGMAEWLGRSSGFAVHIASDREYPLPGHAYLAPEGVHMKLGPDGRIVLSSERSENGHRPAVAQLFRSVASVLGRRAVGVLLTGMGQDGAAELKTMKDRGALTIAQDRQSSVVHGMPGAAILLGGATHVRSPEGIAAALAELALMTRKAAG
jgi:two-component system chemotaxis response regulator CheB